MSEYPKKLVSDEGGVAMVNDAKDEATLKQTGYKDAEPEVADDSPTKLYKVLAPFQYDGEKYEPDDEVDLPDEQAAKRKEKLELIV